MSNLITYTKNSKNNDIFWHFNFIGVGVILSYQISTMQLFVHCEYTGELISKQEFISQGGLTKEKFISFCKKSYLDDVENGISISFDYMDNPTIIGCIGFDFNIIKN